MAFINEVEALVREAMAAAKGKLREPAQASDVATRKRKEYFAVLL